MLSVISFNSRLREEATGFLVEATGGTLVSTHASVRRRQITLCALSAGGQFQLTPP